jgi:Holliday junction resolvasome RuvABC endonuclease subunit
MDEIRIIGIDLSLNHSGLVELDLTGDLTWWEFVSESKAAAGRNGRGIHLPKFKGDRQQAQMERLAWWVEFLTRVFAQRRPCYVGIEDYAFSAASNTSYQIGELGGMARLSALRSGAMLRLHDPTSVKMFGALNGAATATDLVEKVKELWGSDFSVANPPVGKGKPNTIPGEDLAAAYAVARLVWTEVKLRAGFLRLDALHEKQIQVFNRTTKANPVNLLGREWLELEGA